MVDSVYILVLATWFFLIIQKRVENSGDWLEVASRLVQGAMYVFLIFYLREIVTAFINVMTHTWCAIVYPFTQVCKGVMP